MSKEGREHNSRVAPNDRAKVTFVNSLAWACYTMTREEKRILTWLISEVRMKDENFKTHSLDLKEMYQFMGLKKGGFTYRAASDATKKLLSRVVEVEKVVDGEVEELVQFQFISEAHFLLKGDGTVSLRLNDCLAPYLLKISGNFTDIEFKILMSFHSFYSCRLYEISKCELNKSHKKKTKITVPLEVLRDVFGIGKKEYEVFGNFSERVLKPACKEVSKMSDLDVSFSTKRVGRKVGKIVLEVSKKTTGTIRFSQTTFAPGSKNDRLCTEMQKLGLSKRECEKTIERWCEEDPNRVDWHVRYTKNMVRLKKIRVAPAALLRAGIKNDYRSSKEADMRDVMDDLRKREIKRHTSKSEGLRPLSEKFGTKLDYLKDLYKEDWKDKK